MGKDDKGHRLAIIVPVIVAVIITIGVLGVAIVPKLIDRWNVDESKSEPDPVPPKELKQEIVGKDGVPMVLIPAREEYGLHHDAFYMDKYEVTNAVYRRFVDATGHEAPWYWDDPDFNQPGHPVVGVSWNDAVAYCKWAGKRLPREAEWEYAARGGLVGKEYPWGDEITHDDANYGGTGGRDKWGWFTAPVGSFPPNGYGLYDMAGNVWEWCADWYDSEENYRVLRGGGWYCSPGGLRVARRGSGYSPAAAYGGAGFRCVSQDTDVTPID